MPEECDTRWNATYTYLKTCLAYKVPIIMNFNHYSGSFSDCMLHDSDWAAIDDLV